MTQLFDNVCRILATPMPRSHALKLIFGVLVGATLSPFAFGDNCSETAQTRCGTTPSGQPACCSNGEVCCLLNPQSSAKPVCCHPSEGCDGQGACATPSKKKP